MSLLTRTSRTKTIVILKPRAPLFPGRVQRLAHFPAFLRPFAANHPQLIHKCVCAVFLPVSLWGAQAMTCEEYKETYFPFSLSSHQSLLTPHSSLLTLLHHFNVVPHINILQTQSPLLSNDHASNPRSTLLHQP